MAWKERLDRWEAGLARAGAALERPGPYLWASAGLVLVAILVRLPLVARATDVCCGHPDSWVYFHQAYAEYLRGNLFPDGHRGSGWQLLLFATLKLFGFAPATGWNAYGAPMTGEAARAALVAHTLSAMLSVGAVAATLLLAREVLSRPAALLAGALVALDPYLLRLSTSALSEPLYVPLFVLATMTVLRARKHPAWLLATGTLMAFAHMMKVNGLVMFVMLMAFAAILLWHGSWRSLRANRRTAMWMAASGIAFLLVASPYLAWRGSQLSSPFDYGTNQRFWADDLWDLNDAWWSAYTPEHGAPRETLSDYASHHTWRDAATRLWQSVEWQAFDLFGSGRWPAQESEGGAWVGTAPEESALTPLVFALALVACLTLTRQRAWWFLPLAVGATFATFVWIYPLVRSVRYFAPLLPLFSVAAVAGWLRLATLVERPRLVGTAIFGAYFVLYAGVPLLHAGEGVAMLAQPEVRILVGIVGALWMLVALAPGLDALLRRAREWTPASKREAAP
ncbi:MAG TPA: phospholipid carrier-dependent glycosyltransferase [Candidatus Thermoplasmatota archaeon]|nr:phospholipid carrier-dependent glycosyltransferase [Candidatus Thermoplasmatota archaeon]